MALGCPVAPGCLAGRETSASAHHWASRLIVLCSTSASLRPVWWHLTGCTPKAPRTRRQRCCSHLRSGHSSTAARLSPQKRQQQGMLCIHCLREGFKKRFARINRSRVLLIEFGVVFPQRSAALGAAQRDRQRSWAQRQELDDHLAWRLAYCYPPRQRAGVPIRANAGSRADDVVCGGGQRGRLQAVQERHAVYLHTLLFREPSKR